jgi:tRNA (guanosine-2'-O-)-methyltransferase
VAKRREVDELIERYGAARVREVLASYLTEERKDRIDRVVRARLGGLTVAVETLSDPHNGAAAIRSIESLGLCALHVVGSPRFGAAPGISMGSHKWIDVERHTDAATAVAALAARGLVSVATTPDADESIDQLEPGGRYAIWFGNEHEGLSAAALAACPRRVALPMFGFTQSYNLSVSVALATAILASRRRAALGAEGDLSDEEQAHLVARFTAQSVRSPAGLMSRLVSN